MLDAHNRQAIIDAIESGIDGLVRDLYSDNTLGPSMTHEPDITSRLGHMLEEGLNGRQAGDYTFLVISMSIPDRGPNSLEKITGADIVISLSLDGIDGFDKSIFVQAKYDRNLKRHELLDACQRMENVVGERRGAYVWVYTSEGARVLSPRQVENMTSNRIEEAQSYTMRSFAGRILDCYAGSHIWGIPQRSDRRKVLQQRLKEVHARTAIDLHLARSSSIRQ